MTAPPELKFAVVREDPEVELAVARAVGARRVLLTASGGCTALAFAHALPAVDVELYDFNPAQLAHVRRRAAAVRADEQSAQNIGDPDPTGLAQCGAFERLFRVLRQGWLSLVDRDDPTRIERFFDADAAERAAIVDRWRQSPYWPVIFELALHDRLLVTMFGPDAVQHAPTGSYPGYFQRVFERGLARDDAVRNPFLHHVLLQRYRPADAPPFLARFEVPEWPAHLGGVPDVAGLDRFDLVHLSNIFDWCADAVIERWIDALRALKPGAAITLRQLNNPRPFAERLAPWFTVDEALGARLHAADRSLFYERLIVARRAG